MKFKYFYVIVSVLIILLNNNACRNTPKLEDPKDVAEEHNDAKFDDKKNKMEAQFLVDAAEINMEEVILAQLVQQRAILPEVKDLGIMMETSHNKSLRELSELSRAKLITIPTSPTEDSQKAFKKLSEETGKDFDKVYCDMMVKDHKNAIDIFEKAATESSDVDIKQWATASLTRLRAHLDHAMICQKKCEKM